MPNDPDLKTWQITTPPSFPPNTITFCNGYETQLLKISKDGIWANPDVPVDEIARKVFEVLEPMIMQAYTLNAKNDTP